MWDRRPAGIVTAMSPLVLYLVFVAIAVAVALAAMAMARPLLRGCPGCDGDVRLDARTCGACGYAFR
jgi:hypothetical protein